MALRTDASDQSFVRITSGILDYKSNYTICGWCYLEVLPSQDRTIVIIRNDGGVDLDGIVVATSTGVLTITSWTAFSNVDGAGSSVSTGAWHHYAMTRSGSTLSLYLDGVFDNSVTQEPSARGAAQYLTLASNESPVPVFDPLEARWFGWKAWSRALTAVEINAEMRQAMPISGVSIYGVWPFLRDNRANDYSGQGHSWTEVSSPTNADPPNVAFAGSELLIELATTSTANLACDITATVSVVSTATGTGALTSSETGTVSLVGSLTGTGALSGSATGTVTVVGGVTGDGPLISSVTGSGTVAGSATGTGVLASSETGTVSVVGVMTGTGDLTGTVTSTGTLVGSLAGDLMVGEITGTGTLAGAMTGTGALTGVVGATVVLAGALSGEILSTVVVVDWSVPFTLLAGEEWRIVFQGPSADAPSVRIVPTFIRS